MKPALTHLVAAACGALLVFFLLPAKPADPEDPGPRTTPRHNKAPERPLGLRGATGILARAKEDLARGQDLDPDEVALRLMGPPPSRAQLEDWLASRDRDAESLLAAGIILSDLSFLTEALEKNPDDPHILFTLANFHEASPDERLEWSRRLLEVQPHNAMASYNLAAQHFKGGDNEPALAALRASANQLDLEDFSMQTILLTEEAYRGTGSSLLQAKLHSNFNLPTPHLADVHSFAKLIGDEPRQLSDGEAGELRTLAAGIGVRVAEDSPSQLLITELVGLSLQSAAMRNQPEDDPSPFQGLTVGEADASIQARRDEINGTYELMRTPAFLDLPPETLESFMDRIRLIGELPAIEWLHRQAGLQSTE